MGFIIHVSEKIDQSNLPPEDLVPGCLEGVRVEIRERPEGGELIPLRPPNSNTEEPHGSD